MRIGLYLLTEIDKLEVLLSLEKRLIQFNRISTNVFGDYFT